MSFQIVSLSELRTSLQAMMHHNLSPRTAATGSTPDLEATARTIEAGEMRISHFIDEAIRVTRLLCKDVLDHSVVSQVGDDSIIWDPEIRTALDAYFFRAGGAQAFKNLVKLKWNFMAGRYTRYWYPDGNDGMGGLRLQVTRAVVFGQHAAETKMYLPLEPEKKEIRVLQISRAVVNGRLEYLGDLVIVPLGESPRYIAISYAWGSQDDQQTVGHLRMFHGHWSINLTEATTSILENLLDGVARLWVWIDAICINQADKVEKGSQVSMMGDIYRGAQQVVVSLGEADEDSGPAMSLLHRATAAIARAEANRQWPDLSQIVQASGVGMEEWVRLVRFFRRRWFNRIWIVQEVMLGPSPVVVCGKDAVAFDVLSEACSRIMTHSQAFSSLLGQGDNDASLSAVLRHGSRDGETAVAPLPLAGSVFGSFVWDLMDELSERSAPDLTEWPIGISNMRNLWDLDRKLKRRGSETLTGLLNVFGQWDSTDPRDKIFGILSLTDGNTGLVPHYVESDTLAYTKATRFSLSTDSTLDILCKAGVGFERSIKDLPSWVPDWSRPPGVRAFANLAYGGGRDASRGRRPEVRLCAEDTTRIVLAGITIDKIAAVSSVRKKFSAADPCASAQSLLNWVQEVENMVMIGSQDATTDRRRRLWKTLAPEDPKPPYEDGRRTATEGGFDAWRRYLQWQAASPLGGGQLSAEGKFFEVACTYATTHRRAFVTEKGHVGLGYQGTRVGDDVAILLGGVVPFLTRRVSDSSGNKEYLLVGEAYLHGFENGDGVDFEQPESLRFR